MATTPANYAQGLGGGFSGASEREVCSFSTEQGQELGLSQAPKRSGFVGIPFEGVPTLALLPRATDNSCESGEGVRLSREELNSGELLGKSGELLGSLENFRGSSGLLLSSTVRELPGKSPGNF